jgi:hypothetical protein
MRNDASGVGRHGENHDMLIKAAAILISAGLALPAMALDRTAAPDGATAYIVAPTDGATVTSPVTVVFGLAGMGIAPAGVEMDNTGHHHLLIDTDPATIDYSGPLPASDRIVHFGGGQSQVTLDLAAGTHELRLLLGDQNHIPHEPPVLSEPVTITVE